MKIFCYMYMYMCNIMSFMYITLQSCISVFSPMYSYDLVMGEVAELRSVLVDITQGKLASDFHRKMLEGSRKEKSLLKVAPKAGPIANWSTTKVKIIVDRLYLRTIS